MPHRVLPGRPIRAGRAVPGAGRATPGRHGAVSCPAVLAGPGNGPAGTGVPAGRTAAGARPPGSNPL